MNRVVTLTLVLVAPRLAQAVCPSYTTCDFQPVLGTQPSNAAINGLMEELSVNALGDRAPVLPRMEQGPSRELGEPRFPCVLFKAIGVIESGWRQFCADTGLTVISFDCGYGISQITSGAASYGPRITSEPAYNIGAGAKILVGKWNGNQTYGGAINDSNPVVVENWYYATWAYNGFANSNNPHNPNLPANRPPYAGPNSLSRGSYPYQELVWGRIRYPQQSGGQDIYASVEVTYPNIDDIPPPPSGTSLFQQDLTVNPQHANPCVETCEGCPDPREVIVDDADPGFTLHGSAATATAGGYRNRFLHVPAQAAGASVTTADFVPDLPADGVWEVAGYIPLDPANSPSIPVEVVGVGGVTTLRMDQGVVGGSFQVLGRVKVRAGHTRATVRDDSGQDGKTVGLDALRWRWVGVGGAVEPGMPCASSVDCSGTLGCLGGACLPPCWEVPCGASLGCDEDTGACLIPARDGGPGVTSSSAGAPATSSPPVSSSAAGSSGPPASGEVTSSSLSLSSSLSSSSGSGEEPVDAWEGCPASCRSGAGGGAWALPLVWLGWRRRCARRASRHPGSGVLREGHATSDPPRPGPRPQED